MSGAELMQRIAAGQEQALGELYDRYVNTLLGLARQILGSHQDAEEIVQEVILQIWRQADHYDPRRATISTWLILLTRRKAIDRLRKARTAARASAEWKLENPNPAIPPEGGRRVLEGERRARILTALGQLPAEQRQILELAYFQGLTQSQIAERIHIPLGTVKTRSVLALKKLRRSLHGELTTLR